jgi:hypothetical protein
MSFRLNTTVAGKEDDAAEATDQATTAGNRAASHRAGLGIGMGWGNFSPLFGPNRNGTNCLRKPHATVIDAQAQPHVRSDIGPHRTM